MIYLGLHASNRVAHLPLQPFKPQHADATRARMRSDPHKFKLQVAKKDAMAAQLGGSANERWLWHGEYATVFLSLPFLPSSAFHCFSTVLTPCFLCLSFAFPITGTTEGLLTPILANGFLRDYNTTAACDWAPAMLSLPRSLVWQNAASFRGDCVSVWRPGYCTCFRSRAIAAC